MSEYLLKFIHMSKVIKLHMSNLCILLPENYTSGKNVCKEFMVKCKFHHRRWLCCCRHCFSTNLG